MMNKGKQISSIALFFAVALFFSCSSNNPKTKFTDEATFGEVSISVDESYSLLFESLEMPFEHLYKDANVNIQYKPEGDVINDILRNTDSVRFGVISRELNEEEKKYLDGIKVYPKTIKIAYDAVAIIVHPENTNSEFTQDELTEIVSGRRNVWTSKSKDTIQIVFDNTRSGNARYIKEKFLNGAEQFHKNCYALKNNSEVVEYVAAHKNAMGVIGVNWISDKDDSLSRTFLSKIKVCAIASEAGMPYKKPYQAYIAQKSYPLTRVIYIINREGRSGLGTGFASFIAGEKGQRVILKTGLVPANTPLRIVNITNE